jgi:hypothetical protein
MYIETTPESLAKLPLDAGADPASASACNSIFQLARGFKFRLLAPRV